MIIDNKFLDILTARAKESHRKRFHYDLRDSEADTSQRMLNAIEPESMIPVHRHSLTSETVACIRGRVCEILFEEKDGQLHEIMRCFMSPLGDASLIQVPQGTWHTCRSLETGSVILEFKNTKYDPCSTEEIWNN